MKHVHHLILIAYLMLVMVLAACTFDDDTEYYPVTRKAYLLASDSTGGHQLMLIEGGSLTSNWENKLSLTGQLEDLSVFENECWLATSGDNAVHLFDPQDERITQSHTTASIIPSFICQGKDYLLISSQETEEVLFVHKKKGTLIALPVDELPGSAVYRSRKFYVTIGSQQVAIFREEALAELARISVSRPIVELQVDNMISIQVFIRDTALHQTSIDYNTNSLSGTESLLSAQRVQVSPIRVAQYGKEYLRNVQLTNQRLTPGSRQGVSDFETDFFEAQIYYIARDSLFRFSIGSPLNERLGPFSGQIHKSFFFREQIGE